MSRFLSYVILRNFPKALSGRDIPEKLKPGFLQITLGFRTLCFAIQEHASGIHTVFLPLSLTLGEGTLQIVSKPKVQQLEVSTSDAPGCSLDWGAGTKALLRLKRLH